MGQSLKLPVFTRQTRVVGVKYGQWGREKYGISPAKVDTMEVHAPSLLVHATLFVLIHARPSLPFIRLEAGQR